MTTKVVYKHYASLYFIVGVTPDVDNELLTLEGIHRFVGNDGHIFIVFVARHITFQ